MKEPIKTSEVPTGEYCQVPRVLSTGTQCIELDDHITMDPRCRKFKEKLACNISGRIRRCKACIEESRGRES